MTTNTYRTTERTTSAPDDRHDRSFGQLIDEAAHDVGHLLRQEVELAKAEVREEAAKATKAGAKLGAAAFTGYLALLLASFAAAWGLAELMSAGWAFLIVAAVFAVVAAVLYAIGRKEFRKVSPMPRQTATTVREDAEWAREQTRLGPTSHAPETTSARRSRRPPTG